MRRQELLSAVSEPMVKYLKNHTKELVMHSAALLVVLAIITKANCKCMFIKKLFVRNCITNNYTTSYIYNLPTIYTLCSTILFNEEYLYTQVMLVLL